MVSLRISDSDWNIPGNKPSRSSSFPMSQYPKTFPFWLYCLGLLVTDFRLWARLDINFSWLEYAHARWSFKNDGISGLSLILWFKNRRCVNLFGFPRGLNILVIWPVKYVKVCRNSTKIVEVKDIFIFIVFTVEKNNATLFNLFVVRIWNKNKCTLNYKTGNYIKRM